jgi:hypothetical protein
MCLIYLWLAANAASISGSNLIILPRISASKREVVLPCEAFPATALPQLDAGLAGRLPRRYGLSAAEYLQALRRPSIRAQTCAPPTAASPRRVVEFAYRNALAPKQCKQQNDGKGDSKHPKQSAFTEAHNGLLVLTEELTPVCSAGSLSIKRR